MSSDEEELFELEIDNDDDDDDAFDFHAFEMLTNANATKRKRKYPHSRIDWTKHVEERMHKEDFQSVYHMKKESFEKLVDILRSDIRVDEKQSMRSTGGIEPITPELIVAAGLRFLGGATQKELALSLGVSLSSLKRVISMFLDAVVSSDALQIKLPTAECELKQIADEWDEESKAFSIFYGVVGAIDGISIKIKKPTESNDADYFSGHKHHFGLNVQAVCDARQRFIYFGVVAPGKTNDNRAFNRCQELRRWLQDLPPKYFLIGDNAYTLTSQMLIPFSGSDKHSKDHDTYNYYLSQMRMRIEMAFGLLTTKWRIFERSLSYKLERNSVICQVAARLHNFVIDNDSEKVTVVRGLIEGVYEPSPLDPPGERRKRMVEEIETRDMEREPHNILRNRAL